ncbi:hypothetical protein MIR68_007793 [Amoeboaphelidium protococcarum]|nr:hypothetical protein MIR68_007793 [Amoeboaphelidium protococcarum]KAI3645378.1 hypothetical protein MP228_008306 [Amoeboaphelidium protococcarum]
MTKQQLVVGVLALQGAYKEHFDLVTQIALELKESSNHHVEIIPKFIRTAADVFRHGQLLLDGLILGGGESTTMRIVSHHDNQDLIEVLRLAIREHKLPVLGTCAGLILLSDQILDDSSNNGQIGDHDKQSIGGLDVQVRRNFYGPQKYSFMGEIELCDRDATTQAATEVIRCAFIRAPGIIRVNADKVKVLATIKDSNGIDQPVAVQQDNLIGLTFHPELTKQAIFHRRFIDLLLQQSDAH